VVDALEDEYSKVIEKWKPDAVVSEGAYVGIHVSAAIAINLAIHALRRSTYHGIGIDIFVVPPSISKLAFAGRGGADKDAMRLAYTKATYILDKPDEKELSEHIIDSFAHAIGWLSRDVLGTVIQISAQEKRQAKREKEKRKLERESA
jgi:Holliday junction resolvasome RuvABC endonuclease subunit